jgi:hypothetical protein
MNEEVLMATVEELTKKIANEVEFYWSENKDFDEAVEARQRVYELVAAVEARGEAKGRAEGFKMGRSYEATRWAFWIHGEQVCGYSSCVPLAKVLNEIAADDREPTDAFAFGGL